MSSGVRMPGCPFSKFRTVFQNCLKARAVSVGIHCFRSAAALFATHSHEFDNAFAHASSATAPCPSAMHLYKLNRPTNLSTLTQSIPSTQSIQVFTPVSKSSAHPPQILTPYPTTTKYPRRPQYHAKRFNILHILLSTCESEMKFATTGVFCIALLATFALSTAREARAFRNLETSVRIQETTKSRVHTGKVCECYQEEQANPNSKCLNKPRKYSGSHERSAPRLQLAPTEQQRAHVI